MIRPILSRYLSNAQRRPRHPIVQGAIGIDRRTISVAVSESDYDVSGVRGVATKKALRPAHARPWSGPSHNDDRLISSRGLRAATGENAIVEATTSK